MMCACTDEQLRNNRATFRGGLLIVPYIIRHHDGVKHVPPDQRPVSKP
jgi:hypothetical protein